MEVIRIPVDTFWSARVQPAQDLVDKARELYERHACFRENWSAHERRPRSEKHNRPVDNKPRIGKRELSIEVMAEKDFLGMLNKIAPANRDRILATLKKHIRPELDRMYLVTLWEHFLRSDTYQDVLMDVLYVLSGQFDVKVFLDEKWRDYVHSRAWVPPLVERNGAADYDEFCDAVKWRQRAMAILQMWRGLVDHGWLPNGEMVPLQGAIAHDIDAQLDAVEPIYKACEIMFEELGVAVKLFGATECTRDWVHPMRARAVNFPPAVRFKVYDLYDILHIEKK